MELKEAINILEKITFFLELKNENVFKINAFRNAARILKGSPVSLNEGLSTGKFAETKGIGKSIISVLNEINNTGYSSALEELEAEFPPTIYELTEISGLGPKKIKKLYELLGISSIGELEYACKENRLISIEGFGQKTQDKFLNEIERINKFKGYLLLSTALKIASVIEIEIFQKNKIKTFQRTGEIRKHCEIISIIEYLMIQEEADKLKENKNLFVSAENGVYLFSYSGIKFKVHTSSEKDFPFKLLKTTGPDKFITEFFNKELSGNFKSEEEIFTFNNIKYVEPNLRDNKKSFIQKSGSLIDSIDIKGILHIHSLYSDGSNSIAEIASAAAKMGMKYILITDHSKSAFYANGLNEERLFNQWKEIDELNKSSQVKILKGIECDILPDGSLDYSDDILAGFDCVICSVHSSFDMSEEKMTERICKALDNKYCKILGHISGRLLLSRNPYPLNYEKIFEQAKKNGKVIELNSDPHRFDINWRYHSTMKELGIKSAICPDAHSIEGLYNIYLGTEIARKGGFSGEDIINTLPLEIFVKNYCGNV